MRRSELFLSDEQRIIDSTESEDRRSRGRIIKVNVAQSVLNSGERYVELFRSGHRIAKRLAMPLTCGGIAMAVMIVIPFGP